MEVRLGCGPAALGWVLLVAGGWFLLKRTVDPGPWVLPSILTAAALALAVAAIRQRRTDTYTTACLLAGWAVYAWLDGYLAGGLPFSLLLGFLGLGLLLAYASIRPIQPVLLLPAALLLGAATVLYIVGASVSLLRPYLPYVLVALGAYLVWRGLRRRN